MATTTNSMTTTTFKIKFGTHLRRLNLDEHHTLSHLRSLTMSLFHMDDAYVWHFKYQDEDGDWVTLTEEYELSEILRNPAFSVVRLLVTDDDQPHVDQPLPKMVDVVNDVIGTLFASPTSLHSEGMKNQSQCCGKRAQARMQGCPSRNSGQCKKRSPSRCDQPKSSTPTSGTASLPWCAVTGVKLELGEWYHKRGEKYDLACEVYDALSEDQKKGFVLVDSVKALGDDHHVYQLPLTKDQTSPMITDEDQVDQTPIITPPAPSPSPSPAPAPSPSPSPSTNLSSLSYRLLRGPSITSDNVITVGTQLNPVWEVMNDATSGIWTEVRLRPRSHNPLCVREEGFEVPMLAAGESGIVSAEMIVPDGLAGTHVTQDFDMVDGSGETFGEPLCLTVQVNQLDPVSDLLQLVDEEERKQQNHAKHESVTMMTTNEVDNEDELVELLVVMGFPYDASVTTLRDCDGDLQSAAIRLLNHK